MDNEIPVSKELNLQELESATGGYTTDQLTKEEFEIHENLKYRANMVIAYNRNGMMSDEECDAITAEFYAFSRKMRKKWLTKGNLMTACVN